MSNTIIRSLCVVLFGVAAIPGLADAQSSAYTNSGAEIYAGPAPDYPVVAQVPPGTALDVFGCLSDYSWCDVALPGVRGWIDAEQLDYPYQGNYVPLLEYGAIVGVPVTGFAIGAYWDRYYRHRPWFHDRDRWERRAEPRIGPGGMPPAYGRPQPGGPVQRAPGGEPPERHDARPSATRGGWNGPNRAPAPAQQAAPAPAPMPGAAGARQPAPPPPAPSGGAVRMMVPQTHQGGGGYGARPQGGGNGGGDHGGGGRGTDEFRH
ncbi:SH3 domain-containing protein [Burkholderia sp. SCN-KJ]|uniref:SH3 domain-containing protein n=1 Tax=Burkholderia sp. SCN-KJ TaxID=2969248 RepID=UPI00215038BA|nr:SH3 domain-containing protein [Burkholderia sp. SCN-KJ]MCR4466934.1 SH3 domain-containing protein [Burkholderia sp. SCN-KJ]